MENPATEDAPTIVWHPVFVAIYEGGGAFKHWSLFVEDERNEARSFVVHVQGGPGRFRYEAKARNAHESESLIEVIRVGRVQKDKLRQLRSITRDVSIKNHDPTWNCQDFVWSALEEIASEGLIDVEDKAYIDGRQTVWSRMEGLV